MSIKLNHSVLDEIELINVLTQIKTGEKAWSEENKHEIVKSMIIHIGSTNSELRDKLIYTSFFRLIVENNLLEPEFLIELLNICLNDLLLKGIGEKGTDSVFTRAFTTLLIALILYRDNQDDFLSQGHVEMVKDHLILYINNEKDLRGFVPGKGWAHSIAHVADAFDELVKNPKISHALYPEILQPLWNKMFVSDSVYIHEEEERMITPIVEMLNNGLDVEEIVTQVQNIPAVLKARKEIVDEEEYWFLIFNSKTFLKSFYMNINGESRFHEIQMGIEHCLKEI